VQESRAGSYLDGSACHLDLVQWATKPAQGELPALVWERLVEQDREFLQWQLGNSNVTVVLLNGASVVSWAQQAGLVGAFDEDTLAYRARTRDRTIRVYSAVSEGVTFLGWNWPLAGPMAAAGRRRLTRWVGSELRERVSATLVTEGTRAPGGEGPGSPSELVNGYVPVGTTVNGAAELERLLAHWAEVSNQATVGDVGAYGGSPVVIVRLGGGDELVLNRDTKRAAVLAFLTAAATGGGADRLPWHVTANSRGTVNRVSYRPDDDPIPGWYAYLRTPSPEPRKLRDRPAAAVRPVRAPRLRVPRR
jgi:hypothetical protein